MNKIDIKIQQPLIYTPDSDGFHPFTLSVSSNNITSEPQQLYFHKCNRVEYQEYNSDQKQLKVLLQKSIDKPETVYFYNEELDLLEVNPTSQLNSKRTDEVEEENVEERSESPTTLYFIPEEESES